MFFHTKDLRNADGNLSRWSKRLKKCIVTGLLAAALTASFLSAAAGETDLDVGQTYYFDLSAKYDDIRCLENLSRGDINSHQLPDATLHYVPFTYAGAVKAYALPEYFGEISTDSNVVPYTAERVLFLADYPLSTQVSWSALDAKGLIYGMNYDAGGARYLLRAPSGGSDDVSSGVVPANNEWDVLGRKGLIKNFSLVIAQDYANYSITPDMRAVRGSGSSYSQFSGINRIHSMTTIGFRPVLEVLDADSTNLKTVTLKLNGGSLHSNTADVKLAVKAGASFAAPASLGLTFPTGETALAWRGDDGKLYSVGASVPDIVKTLRAEYGYAIINTLTGLDTNNPDIYRSKTVSDDYTATLSPQNGYKLPDALTVSVGGTTLQAGNDTYTYNKTSGLLTIKAAVIKGDVKITASGVDVRKPVLEGSAVRTSDLTATVRFTSDEAGFYYYKLVEHGAQAPTISTSGSGTPCGAFEQTIYLDNLGSKSAKDLYVVVKDGAGNVSLPLFIPIAVYSTQKYAILVTPAVLDFGSREAGYGTRTGSAGVPEAQTVTVKNTGNYPIDVSLPKLSNFHVIAKTNFTKTEGLVAPLEAGQTATFTVQPKDWMPIQDETLTLTINGSPPVDSGHVSAEVSVSFVVTPTPETFSLPVGETYYFDLSALAPLVTEMDHYSEINKNLPDQTLHYVPFTYAGTVKAYSLSADKPTGSNEKANTHSLFIADYNVFKNVSWVTLNTKGLIYGKSYTGNEVDYTLRVPSGGSSVNGSTGSSDNKCAQPIMNEWDAILDKCNQSSASGDTKYIKNWGKNKSWVQDAGNNQAVVRGGNSPRSWAFEYNSYYDITEKNYRPVLEVPSTFSADDLRVVTLKLNGVKLGGNGDDLKLAVKTGAAFPAPAGEGLTPPDGVAVAGQTLLWRAENGILYAPGESVPATVTRLTAEYGYTIVNSLTYLTTDNTQNAFIPLGGGDYIATLTPANGYLLPDTISVNVGTSTLTPGAATYTYDSTTGSLTIKAAAITGNTTITAEGRGQSAAPATDTDTVAKTAAVQTSVVFTLTNNPAYVNGLDWTVYAAATGTELANGVTASNAGNTLTLSHGTDIPADTYYVAVTQTGKAESRRLPLTVAPYQAPSVSLGSDTTVFVVFAYADTGAKYDKIDIVTSTGTDTTVTFPITDFTLSDSDTTYTPVTGVRVTAVVGGTLTVSIDKSATATTAYLWYGGKSVGAITLKKTVQGRTAAPGFTNDSYTLTDLTDKAAIFTLNAAPASGTVFTVYAGADGTATAGTAALSNGTTLTIDLSAIPATATVCHISATCAPNAESARTPVTVNPYVLSTDNTLSDLSYKVDNETPTALTPEQISTAALTDGFSVVLPYGTSPTAAISLLDTPTHGKAAVTSNDGTTLIDGKGTATLTVKAESGATSTYSIHFSIQGQSAAPTASAATVTKTSAVQTSVVFTLTNNPAYVNGLDWTVYAAATGTELANGVTASNAGNTLTLSHGTDIPADTYYVAVTQTGKAESRRLPLTVAPYQAPSVSLGSDTKVSVAFAYAETGAKYDKIDIVTSTGTDTTVTFPFTAFTLSDSATTYTPVTGVSVTDVGSGTLTVSIDKSATATSAYLWYGGKSVGLITIEKSVGEPSRDATLKALSYSVDDGTATSLSDSQLTTAATDTGFDVVLPYGTSATAVVTLVGATRDAGASFPSNSNVTLSGGLGTATLTVTAQDGVTTKTYTIRFIPTIAFTTHPHDETVTQGYITQSLTAAAVVSPSCTATLNWFACNANGQPYGDSLGTGDAFAIPTTLTVGNYYYCCIAKYAGASDVKSDVAKVTVLVSDPLNVNLSPSGMFIQGMAGELIGTISSNASGFDINNFNAAKGVQMSFENGPFVKLIQGSQCDIVTGSIKVTLHSAYLNTLAVGRYTLRVNLTGAGYPPYVDTTLTVMKNVEPPKTGDSSTPWLWLLLCLFSGALLFAEVRKRQKE